MAKIHIDVMDQTAPQVRSIETPIDEEKAEDFNLERELRLLHRTMAVFGMYFAPKTPGSSRGLRDVITRYSQQLYCIVIQVLLWLNGFRLIISFWFGDELCLDPKFTPIKIMMCAWCFQCALNNSIWYHLCSTRKLHHLFRYWQERCQSSNASRMMGTCMEVSWIRRRIRLISGGCIAVTVFNSMIFVFTRFGPFEALANDTCPIVAPFPKGHYFWETTFVVIQTYASCAFMLPVGLFLIICIIINRQFEMFTERFKKCINYDGAAKLCLAMLRRQHQYLAKAVLIADNAFSFYLAVTITATLFIACFGMYQVVIAQNFESVMTLAIIVFWMVIVSMIFGIIGIFASQVYDKVSRR